MLCRKFKNILVKHPTNNNVYCRPLVQTRSFSKWFDLLSGRNMAVAPAIRLKLFRDLFLTRVLNAWTRGYRVNSLFQRCRTERNVNKMFLYFRQMFFRPRIQFLVTVSAAMKNTEEKSGPPKKCKRNIKDKEMRRLIRDLESVEDLSKATLYCEGCDKRIVIDNKHKGVQYCDCPHSQPPVGIYDGWVPYMEAEDIIIWRKEYKPGGLYAYKVYGRYKHLKAEDFAMIQVDSTYRKVWDSAVASISVVEQGANGVQDQTVLHWEVLWPSLFANRDYVYLRRHKEFNVKTRCLVHKDGLFPDKERCIPDKNYVEPCKRVPQVEKPKEDSEEAKEEEEDSLKDNKVYVIVSRSCTHPEAPPGRKVVRVEEYWSHMVITTLNGPGEPGMEFVLTYYDEPAVGGLPTAVTSWAMGRAGPAFLERMRLAAKDYLTWRVKNPHHVPDFPPFGVSDAQYSLIDDFLSEEDLEAGQEPEQVQRPEPSEEAEPVQEAWRGKADGSTQTRPVIITPIDEPRDGPKTEAEAKLELPPKYASNELAMPINDGPLQAMSQGQGDADPLKYQLILSKSSPQDVEEELVTLDDKGQHLKITIQLPMSEITRLAEKSDDVIEDITVGESVETLVDSVKQITTTLLIVTDEPTGKTESEDGGDSEGERDSTVKERTPWWRYLYPLYYFV